MKRVKDQYTYKRKNQRLGGRATQVHTQRRARVNEKQRWRRDVDV